MRTRRITLFAAAAIAMAAAVVSLRAEHLVILHTNDTHSTIEPTSSGVGGILQRQAIIDSVRAAEPNTILVDAGDMVQGSLYFKFFRGDVEYPLFNMAGYDIRILGNHEFDNGMEELARQYRKVKGARLSSNYDFTDTPLRGLFDPYVIKKVRGKKIGFIGLNVNPESLIVEKNYEGMKYLPSIETANRTAEMLKKEKKCDMVVVVSHIGYSSDVGEPTDVDLARSSRYIDMIIGGHSHTLLNPSDAESKYPSVVSNSDGRPVVIGQTGKYGRYIGKMDIDLESLGKGDPKIEYSLIPVTDRFPEASLRKDMKDFIAGYKAQVDSVNAHVIGRSAASLTNDRNGGYANFAGDFAMWYADMKLDSLRSAGVDVPHVDMAVMNVGGIRQNMPVGNITEGQILSTFPFSNSMVVIELKGADIIEAMKVAARKGGEAISGNVRVVTDGKGELLRVVINGREMDPDKTYVVSTIDYVAEGNDGLRTMANHRKVWRDEVEMCAPMLRYIHTLTDLGLPVAPDPTPRFVDEVKLCEGKCCK